MVRKFVALLFGVLLLLPAGISSAQADNRDIIRNAISGFILSGYERFAGEARLTHDLIEALCEKPNATMLGAVRDQFGALVTNWSRIETVRFGPVLKDNRLERILFWPDRRSIGLRQVQAVLATKDQTAIHPLTLRQKSVALQGLGALEFTLFGTGSDQLITSDGTFRCTYARTIADALTMTGDEIANDWKAPEGIAHHMRNPSPEWDDYRTEREVLQELLGVWVHGAELIRDTRIKPFFADTAKASKYKSALFWRSNLTIPAIRANASGMRDLFIVSGLSDALSPEMRWAGGALIFEFENFDRTASEVVLPIIEAVIDGEARSKINYLLILTGSLQNLTIDQIAVELGLSVGFSALDGD